MRLYATLALAFCLHPNASAQGLSLDKTGGGIPGSIAWNLRGTPNTLYGLLLGFSEQVTPVPELGITLAINLDFASISLSLPGFLGTLSGSGTAAASLAVPNDPGLQGAVLSCQAIGAPGPFVVSNLVRVTPQVVGTFAFPLNQPPLPIAGGGFATAPDGGLLFLGGSGPAAQLYKSRTEEWELAGATFGVGLLSQTTGLPDGRVLFTGGLDLLTGQPTTAAAVYDPVTQQTTTLAMAFPRAGHGASVMGNGKVLITGGYQTFDLTNPLSFFQGIQATTEVFDPASGVFTPGPTMLEPRGLHTSTTLTSGQVLIAGGMTLLPIVNLPTVSATAYRFNPATNSFGFPAFFSGSRFMHSAVGLSNGRVLIAGGLTLDLTTFLQTGNLADIIVGTRTDCQVYTPAIGSFGTFATVAGMQEGRAGAALAPLPGGGALIAGGFQLTIDLTTNTFVIASTASADVFSQGPNAIVPTGPMAAPRQFPVTANLPDGTILVVGGGPVQAEIYQR
jgi:hypothetical protein